MIHPTPAEIESQIYRALAEDYDKHPVSGDTPFIPIRTFRLIKDAISAACDAKGNQQ